MVCLCRTVMDAHRAANSTIHRPISIVCGAAESRRIDGPGRIDPIRRFAGVAIQMSGAFGLRCRDEPLPARNARKVVAITV
jgi:hypothetical protein